MKKILLMYIVYVLDIPGHPMYWKVRLLYTACMASSDTATRIFSTPYFTLFLLYPIFRLWI